METKEEKAKRGRFEATRFNLWIWFLHLLAVKVLAFSLFPMVLFFYAVWKWMGIYPIGVKILAFSFSIAIGYFLFGTALIFLCVFARNLFQFKIAPGLYTIHSMECLRWMGYNSLFLLANSAFLDVLRLSPFQTLFYRLMGARLGAGGRINTGGLADLEMLEIGDGAVIGGGGALICHALAREVLYLEPTRIGKWAAIGMGSVIMPGCQVGDGAVIPPLSY